MSPVDSCLSFCSDCTAYLFKQTGLDVFPPAWLTLGKTLVDCGQILRLSSAQQSPVESPDDGAPPHRTSLCRRHTASRHWSGLSLGHPTSVVLSPSVRKALQAGGADFHGVYPPTGKEFGPALEALGFHEITVKDPDKFSFIKGDVMVMEPHTGSTAGHVAGYDGKRWISDFVQRDFWAGKEYRKERPHYAVYRY